MIKALIFVQAKNEFQTFCYVHSGENHLVFLALGIILRHEHLVVLV